MFEQLKSFLDRSAPGAQILSLGFVMGSIVLFLWLLGDLLTPFLITVIVFYLLDSLTSKLQKHRLLTRVPPVILAPSVLLLAMCLFFVVLMILIPFAFEQLSDLLTNLRTTLAGKDVDQFIATLTSKLPFDTPELLAQDISATLREYLRDSQQIQSLLNSGFLFTITSAGNLFSVLVSAVIIPVAVFFLMVDKKRLSNWLGGLFPARLSLCVAVWERLNDKMGDYVRGKIIEVVMLTSLCLIGFSLLGIDYAVLLSTLVGLAAIVPILGLIIVTIPIVIIAYLQWGFSEWFWSLLLFYTIVQAFDGYILIPLLFGEVINLHPLAIIFGIFFFGQWFGIWGVFFAIPLVILIHTILLLVPQEFNKTASSDSPPS